MTGWSFYVIGTPAPQGSKSPKGRTKDGHAIMVESSKALKPWREMVRYAAPPIERTLDGPLAVKLIFTMPRPKSARKRDVVPCAAPDCDKLARGVLDAITQSGLWRDDGRVAEFTRLAKVWSGYDPDAMPVPGALIACVEIEPGYHLELDRLFYQARNAAIMRIRGVA